VTVLDVNWRWDNIPQRTTLLVGDTVSTPGWWGRAVRFGGVQYGTNFGLQPGFVTYPLMAVSGLASVPSTADILINNVRVAEQNVPAGPFTISNLPTDRRRQLGRVVRDPRKRVITQPFVAQQLLGQASPSSRLGRARRVDYRLRTSLRRSVCLRLKACCRLQCNRRAAREAGATVQRSTQDRSAAG
jgi:hypothetical protein